MKRRIMFFVFLSFYFLSTKTTLYAQQFKIITNEYIGCTDKSYFNKLVDYAVQGDDAAFKRACAAGLLAGVCTQFIVGEKVYLADVSIWSGLVKLRRPGEIKEYWTVHEAIKAAPQTSVDASVPTKPKGFLIKIISDETPGYTMPSTNSEVLTVFDKNTFLEAIETKGQWVKVTAFRGECWIPRSAIKVIDLK